MRIIIMMLGWLGIYWLNIYLQHFQYVLISTVLVFFVELVVGYLEVRIRIIESKLSSKYEY